MTRISRIEFYHVTIPLKDPFYPSWIPGYPQTDSRFTLLELTTDDGVTGWAAGNAFADERSGLGSLLGPYLVGDGFTIGVDANQGWRVTLIEDAPLWDLDRATDFAKACEDFNVAWLEEPLDMHAYDELAELRRRTRTKIAGCELNIGWQEAKVMLEKGSLDIYQPDSLFCGGLTTSKQIYEACLERGLEFTPHTWTNGVGFIINLHAFAAYPERRMIEYPYEPPGWIPEVRDGILEEPIAVSGDGTIAVPREPGLGLRIDRKKLRRCGTRFYKGTKVSIALNTIRQKGLRTALEIRRAKEGGRSTTASTPDRNA